MRKSAAALSLSLLAATLTAVPAHAADGVVTIAWADATHKAVRVA
ncbi:hypothetical protein [Kribbella qitaiheensis]|nr:hypothetical protein [Kribbella qitaiheensis]